jgi:NCS1 family nucleobase:cation symporter-1
LLKQFADSWHYLALARNAPDFASRATNPSAAWWPQLIAMPLGFSVVSFIGIIVSSSATVIFGTPVWSPVDLLNMFLDGTPSHTTRFGVSEIVLTTSGAMLTSMSKVWFISASFIVAQLGTNISANSLRLVRGYLP